ncbi:TrbG/VirB9 family P-type conjugative transfer protein [Acidithiobacillus sulfuriphilus]|uniref:TrbG/VirB9 family P-type conjugative transfer protein n=1 Tax=Acidithiobacillus sulfuriphilus TaxID=1867749 RepID=UPI003F600E8A
MRHANKLLKTVLAAALVIGTPLPGADPAWAGPMREPAVAGQSLPVAQTINTDKLFQSSAVANYGQPMRVVERRMIRAYEDGRIPELPIFVRPGGEVIVPLGQVLPILQTSPGNFSAIVLGRGVHPVSLVGAPAAEWVVTTSYAGHHPVLEIMPRFAGLKGSIQIVATSPHGHPLTYTIGLASGEARFTPELAFYRLPYAPLPARRQSQPPQPTAASVPAVNATEIQVNWKVRCFVGNCQEIRPLSVVGNGKETLIRLPPARLPGATLPGGKCPMVLVRNREGISLPVSYHLDGNTLVVGAVPHRIDLIAGPWKELSEIRITREGD